MLTVTYLKYGDIKELEERIKKAYNTSDDHVQPWL